MNTRLRTLPSGSLCSPLESCLLANAMLPPQNVLSLLLAEVTSVTVMELPEFESLKLQPIPTSHSLIASPFNRTQIPYSSVTILPSLAHVRFVFNSHLLPFPVGLVPMQVIQAPQYLQKCMTVALIIPPQNCNCDKFTTTNYLPCTTEMGKK